MDMKTDIGIWIEKKFVEFQNAQGHRTTLDVFAAHIGISRSTLNKWMNGINRPDKSYVGLLADKLGPEIYDLMEMPRPDPNLMYIVRRWPALTLEQRKFIREQAERYAGLSETGEDVEPVKTRGTK